MEQDEDRILSLPKIEVTTPRRENHSHRMQLIYFRSILVIAVVSSFVVLGVVSYTAIKGTPDAQRLAYGILGAATGALWSQAAKLLSI